MMIPPPFRCLGPFAFTHRYVLVMSKRNTETQVEARTEQCDWCLDIRIRITGVWWRLGQRMGSWRRF